MPTGCGYQGYEFGAGLYPDSICADGWLFDADNCYDKGNLYKPAEDIPCPLCNRARAIAYWAERNRLGGASVQEARKAAVSLVTDIRRNRGEVR